MRRVMENPTILVADGDPKNLQILRDSLEASGFEVIVAADGLQAWQKISSEVPDLILSEVNLPKLDGFQLLEKLKADPATSTIPLMFLTNRRELQDRVRSLRGGVKDYMIKPLHVKEVLARIRMILRRMERVKEEEVDSSHKLVGRLEEFSPVDLIESFGVERKTGVLTLNNENNRSGEIYFREGAVVNSSLGNLKAEKAVYQMLPWKRGHFTMIFKDITVPDEISVSNLGLLLQGFKRIEEREQLFKQLPSPETTFAMTETFRSIMQKREASPEVAKFISLIDGRRDILQIIDESTYDDIKTLERLVKLYQQGFIKPAKPAPQIAPPEEETPFSQNLAEPKLVQKILQEPPETKRPAKALPEPRVVDLPPYRPDLRLPAFATSEESMEDFSNRLAPPENGEAQKPDTPFTAITPAPPDEFNDPFAKESLERSGETSVANDLRAKDDRISEEDALAAQDLSAAPEDEDAIEIHEIASSPDSDLNSGFDVDRFMRTVGRGLSPEYIEPDLLPLDLREIMQRPVAPPPFLKETKNAENGEATPTFPFIATPPASEPSPFASDQTEEAAGSLAEVEQAASDFVADISAIVDLPKSQERLAAATEAPLDAPPPKWPAQEIFVEPDAPAEEDSTTPPVPEEVSPFFALAKEEKPALVETQHMPAVPHEAMPEAEQPEPFFDLKPPKPVVPVITPPPKPAVPPVMLTPVGEAPVTTNSADLITAALLKLAQRRGLQRPKLVVIGRDGLAISAFVRNTLGAESTLRKMESATFQHLEIGERKLMGQPCDVIGISMEQQFTKLLATAAQELSAYVMLVEAHRQQEFTYLSYLLATLKTSYRLPFGIAMMRSKDQKNLSKETIRDLLNLAEVDYLQECNPLDAAEVAGFLSGLASDENLAHWAERK